MSVFRERIGVIGSGSWGTALSILLAKNNHSVTLWTRREELCETLTATRENKEYLPNIKLPENIQVTYELEQAVKDKQVLIFVVPTHAMRETAEQVKQFLEDDTLIISASKGFEIETLHTMSQVLADTLFKGDNSRIAVLSGPNHAEEVSKEIPSATVIASKKRSVAEKLQGIFMSSRFRVYTNPDVIGVEMGGALKNIMALGSGISDGLGFGDNTKAAFMTRGIYEISRLGITQGARPMTFAGLSGIGDLIVTCTSDHSRNRRAGKLLGSGKKLEDILATTNMVVEGVKTTKAAYYLAEKTGTEMPITKEIYNILFHDKSPEYGVSSLMERVRTNEMEEVVDWELWEE
ncbi:NAD(P)H-dependent glycerol-3-phosphate dehydrogenase [Natranaerobius thermophilus]|uniref:Glycerol-3-phosphate dehydrogenase [NAD(P)+] n=1 Tax=Natranaerobius thermophilus (strain ATCC BAA-1301 / DSM 18059 / JW/NM-WN-LF) TaxID=457570 RepID=B2A4M7_NATTJ|nr:NAD(P)H-dependent glycerol-3-phosphate dehydrogenase [Natranaerobius thermophilus]ACB85202.1 Glycerol-3-phosphate dehydrogenase (NAD(P)(+)) [Natranaerobius thermophilus JW/NM-WN-LF]